MPHYSAMPTRDAPPAPRHGLHNYLALPAISPALLQISHIADDNVRKPPLKKMPFSSSAKESHTVRL